MANEHAGHRSRIRDRVRKESLENFQDYQVLEYALTFVIPYRDTNVMAHELINKFGSLAAVLEADEEELKTVKGISDVAAHFLSHMLQIYHYYEKERVDMKGATLGRPQECYYFAKQFLKGKLIEELYVICLSSTGKVLRVEKLMEGSTNEISINMQKIMECMIKNKSNNLVIAHNHPKGFPEPSEQDNRFTKALVANLTINGCHLLDHIIIGDESLPALSEEETNKYYSYCRAGLLQKYKEEVLSVLTVQTKASQPMAKYEVD